MTGHWVRSRNNGSTRGFQHPRQNGNFSFSITLWGERQGMTSTLVTEGEGDKVRPSIDEGSATDYLVKPLTKGALEEKLLNVFQSLKKKM